MIKNTFQANTNPWLSFYDFY